MANYIVLYDSNLSDVFAKDVQPLLEALDCEYLAFNPSSEPQILEQRKVIVWLPDVDLYSLLPQAVNQQWQVGFLPHPEMTRAYQSFNILAEIEEAIEDISLADEASLADLLYCNSQLVLGSVTVGNPITMKPTANLNEPFWSKWSHFFSLAFNFSQMRLQAYTIETAKQSLIQTALLGMTIVYKPNASDFTQQIIEKSSVQEPNLNAVLLAPRSITEVLRFLVTQILTKHKPSKSLPDYIGHIKTEKLTVSSESEIEYRVDESECSAKSLEINLQRDALQVLSHSAEDKANPSEQKESIRLSRIPKGESSAKELSNRSLPWIHHEDPEELKETFITLKENAQLSESYLVLMVLSTLLATVGLFANSAPVIIGAMILAPLMAPIISFSMGMLRQNIELLILSSKTLLIGIFLALTFGTLLSLFTPLNAINSEIGARLSPTLLDLGVAIISGIAAAYANARSEVAKSLAGVAIAVALVPPLAVSGIGIGWLDWHVFWGAFLLFMTNLFGIVLAASATFLVMGFSPFRVAKKGMLIALIFAITVSIPLTLSFNKMVMKQDIISTIKTWNVVGMELRDIKIRDGKTMVISLEILSKNRVENQQIDELQKRLENSLNQPVRLEARTAILRE
ncbi:TIGR00341 family protein [Thiomicrorhabdus sp. Milos-T2]|uniref:TIGR00341 family protein n=1 Tax=Thiomicrorhabdus sp. Milos-T2 TaxID=90814 RepID=UPI0004948ED2|nr:TIGR00341 family protein [Thiomicrorhabdus sp. Milos-T2]